MGQAVVIAVSVVALVLTACGPSPGTGRKEASTAREPTFNPLWVPAAAGKGNFEVCYPDARENGLESVTIPARIIFQSWGPLTGPLATSINYNLPDGGAEYRQITRFGVMTVETFTLTTVQPCRIVQARAVLNSGEGWRETRTLVADHLSFQSLGFGVSPKFVLSPSRWNDNQRSPVRDAVEGVGINATPVGDIADSVTLIEKD